MLDTVTGMLSHDLAIDLGTSNTLVYARGRGVVCREPTVIAVGETERGGRELLAVGREAKAMLGRTPSDVQAIRPLREGVIQDFQATEELLRVLIRRVHGRRPLVGPRLAVCIPYGTTDVERRAVRESAESAGARQVLLIDQPLAAAIGAELAFAEPEGNMVADVGGGTTEVAVVSLGGIVYSRTVPAGGDHMDDAIVRFVQERHGLLIGPRTAEQVKMDLGSALPDAQLGAERIKGRCLKSGFPRMVSLQSQEVAEALAPAVGKTLEAIRGSLERTPPELSSDIVDKGIMLTGGGALLRDLDAAIRQETGLPVVVAEDPLSTVVLGAARALEDEENLGGVFA